MMRNKIIETPNGKIRAHKLRKRRRIYPSLFKVIITYHKEMIKLDEYKPTPKRKKAWMRWGSYFGFPKCCVRAFVNKPRTEKTENQAKFFNGNGFIPCSKHADLIVSGATTIEKIIRNRKHKLPFPQDY